MALATGTIFECNASATASNVNGGGFNPANANFLTDGTVDTNTGNTASPVFSSASYNFVAGDVGAWLFIKSGTNWTPGYYQIASVASNKATLSAAIGAANQVSTALCAPSPLWQANTVVGVATVGTPTSGTWGVDYSRGTAAIVNGLTDFNAVGASTTLTSVTAPFRVSMVGNLFHQTTTGTGAFGVVGWYEIASYVNTTTVVLDRTPNSGTASVNTTGYVGGAMSLNSTLDDDLFELGLASVRFFIKNGSYSLGESVNVTTGTGTITNPAVIEGYNSIRGDAPTSANMPFINCAANTFIFTSNWEFYYLLMSGTAPATMTVGNTSKAIGNKIINTSTTVDRAAIIASPGTSAFFFKNECIAYRGRAISSAATVDVAMIANYCHDSNVGIALINTSGASFTANNICANNVTAAIQATASDIGNTIIMSNTLYGSEAKMGIGQSFAAGTTNVRSLNNILYGFATGTSHADTQAVGFDDYNCYNNNTANVSAAGQWQTGVHNSTLNPTFTSASQVTGTAGKFDAGGSKLVDTTKNFTSLGVVGASPPTQFVYISAGTGITAGIYGITSISTTTNPNDTLNLDITPGTNTTTDKVYSIPVTNNFAIGTNLKALGYPGVFPGGLTTGYLDIGAAQRQESSGSGGSFTFGS